MPQGKTTGGKVAVLRVEPFSFVICILALELRAACMCMRLSACAAPTPRPRREKTWTRRRSLPRDARNGACLELERRPSLCLASASQDQLGCQAWIPLQQCTVWEAPGVCDAKDRCAGMGRGRFMAWPICLVALAGFLQATALPRPRAPPALHHVPPKSCCHRAQALQTPYVTTSLIRKKLKPGHSQWQMTAANWCINVTLMHKKR